MGVQMFSYAFLILVLFLSNAMFGINLPFVSGQCVQNQKDLLLELKNNLTYDPSLSTKLVYWNESIDCCQWGGVKCDSRGRVTGLDLSNEFISAGIDDNASSLFKLEFLKSLNLAYNDFGSIQLPSGFGLLTSLRYLNLSNADFSGQIPAEFSSLTRLIILDLSSFDTYMHQWNSDFASFSYSRATLQNPDLTKLLQNFTQLRELYLDGVNISANGYQWCNAVSSSLPNLRVLSLTGSYITGPFGSSLAKLQFLSVIHLDYNDFSSPFPDFFADFPSLRILTMTYCNLYGVTPGKLFQVPSLQTIDLSENELLEGSLPKFPLNGSLQDLFLSGTNFSGNLHESIGNLKILSNVDLSYCRFSGSIPNSFGNLTRLTKLDLSINQFTGRVPSFALQKNLTSISLQGNKLTGQISHSLWEGLESLESLDLSRNSLEGEIPASLFILPALKSIHLNNNRFYGSLRELTNGSPSISSLAELDLSDNILYGEIPNWIWELGNGNLESLNLSHNQFTSLQEPYDLSSMVVLDLVLDLHSNMIGGRIPVPPSPAIFVDFSNNNFSSSLPENIGNSQSFPLFFSVANNNIRGTIPPSLCNTSGIEFLDLSNNSFHGRIPSCLVSETRTVLNLRRNNLSGDIPDMFPTDCGLETLDLSWNGLQGQVPISLSRCSYIKVLNLGHNSLNGTFPCSFKNMSALRVLDLRSNKFHGNISCVKNYTLPNLQIIDVASNNFNGVLPGNLFQNMNALMVDVNGTQSQFDYLHSAFSYSAMVDYKDSVTINLKGLVFDLVKILTTFTLIDFSSNHFEGVIPETIGELKSLYVLNFAHNALSGQIPSSLGNLHRLESLDLSFNHLGGEIPQQLASLTFLEFLNLSHNDLVGTIPQGNQMNTFSESSFQGNKGLCGFQLNISCGPEVHEQRESDEEHESTDNRGIYISAELGFVVGLGVVYMPLLFSSRWRRYFNTYLNKFLLFVLCRHQ